MSYTLLETSWFLLSYGLLGWLCEAVVCSVARKRFVNRGFLNMPLRPSCGMIFCVLLEVLPRAAGNPVFQFIITVVLVSLLDYVIGWFTHLMSGSHTRDYERISLFSGDSVGAAESACVGTAYYLVYLLIHPFNVYLIKAVDPLLMTVVMAILWSMAAVDFVTTLVTLRKLRGWEQIQGLQQEEEAREKAIYGRISRRVWSRLERAYPALEQDKPSEKLVFAKGLCFDKLIWVFLISAFLGDMIETIYCRIAGGVWMSRSSVLYGPFSLVWGVGAVLLTLVLQRIAEKPDRYIFLAGALVGGVFEYACSVFTEVALGTTFWDYSDYPFNIDGRTNLLYCLFWGILAVFWVKVCYPPMSKAVEKLPPIPGKVLTWAVVLLMCCNALLSAAAMIRYTERMQDPEQYSLMDTLLDEAYDDGRIESVWPNMRITALGSETIGVVKK